MIWGCQNFQKEYQILANLKNIIPTILVYLLSTIITVNILKYIRVLLKLSLSLLIYRQLLDYLNLTYIVSLIRKSEFKDLDFFLLCGVAIGKILMIIIFMDKINNTIQMVKYLRLNFLSVFREKNVQTIL